MGPFSTTMGATGVSYRAAFRIIFGASGEVPLQMFSWWVMGPFSITMAAVGTRWTGTVLPIFGVYGAVRAGMFLR